MSAFLSLHEIEFCTNAKQRKLWMLWTKYGHVISLCDVGVRKLQLSLVVNPITAVVDLSPLSHRGIACLEPVYVHAHVFVRVCPR